MKKPLHFAYLEWVSYSLIGLIPYLLALWLILWLDVEVTLDMLLVALFVLMIHLAGYKLLRQFGSQLRHVHEKTARAVNATHREEIELDGNAPDELAGIVLNFNSLLAESRVSARNYQEMTAKMMLYARDIERYQKKLREENEKRSRLTRYVDHNLVDRIINSEQDTLLQNTRQEATILFADIRMFTTISEHMSPEEVISMLNDYFDAMVQIIFRNQGVLDKFVGDELMATFGLIGDPDQGPINSVRAAAEIQERLGSLMNEFKFKGYPKFEVGIGVNTGEVVIGSVGSRNRMDYTVIGDTVNVAARLEQMATGNQIIIGEETANHCQQFYGLKHHGDIKVKNRLAAVKCYEVIC